MTQLRHPQQHQPPRGKNRPTAYRIERVQARSVRDEVLDLLHEHQHWPGEDLDSYRALWEWRYTALSDGEPLVWVARDRDQERLIGHLALFRRRFRCGTHSYRGAVPGDLLVHREWRSAGLALDLLRTPCSVVRAGELDFLLSLAPRLIHRLHLKLRFRDLGPLDAFVDPRQSAAVLRRRFAPAVFLAPLADGYLLLRRLRHRRAQLFGSVRRRFRLRVLEESELSNGRWDHWAGAGETLAADDSGEFLTGRFFTRFDVRPIAIAITEADGLVQGLCVVRYQRDRAEILHCQTNGAVLDVPMAVVLVTEFAAREASSVTVRTVADSQLAASLRTFGYVRREDAAHRLWGAAFIPPGHPLEASWSQPVPWHVFSGHVDL